MKNLALSLLILFVLSCGTDDSSSDTSSNLNSRFIGTWEFASRTVNGEEVVFEQEELDCLTQEPITFYKDGTSDSRIVSMSASKIDEDTYSYTCDVTTFSGEYEVIDSSTITFFSETEGDEVGEYAFENNDSVLVFITEGVRTEIIDSVENQTTTEIRNYYNKR